MDDELVVARQGNILIMTINRPGSRNAINHSLACAIATTIDEFEDDDELAIGILTGAGRTFCSGMDLKAFVQGKGVGTHRGLLGMTECPPAKPMIAAVEGWALAGGCELALSCDLIIAANDAQFGIPEVKRGILAAAGGLLRLPLALPYHVAMELALTGEPLPARRAYELGMVNRLTEPGLAVAEALSVARVIANNGPLATRTSKWIMSSTSGWDDPNRWSHQQPRVDAVLHSEDALEGANAFAQKRPPKWSGR